MIKQNAEAIAQTLLDGFNKHYRLFREASSQAKERFERADWHAQQQAQRDRIAYYDARVNETVGVLEAKHQASTQAMDVWAQTKLHYIGLLTKHLQPELAETFFNSVTCKILHRSYFHNDFLFMRPAASTDYIENDEPQGTPTYRVFYPKADTLVQDVKAVILHFGLNAPFAQLDHDASLIAKVMLDALYAAEKPLSTDTGVLSDEENNATESTSTGLAKEHAIMWRDNVQIQVLSSLFYRNKAAYVVGKLVNGHIELPFALPILHSDTGLIIDAALMGASHLLKIFSFARAYFMVDMAVPSATVQFLRSMMPTKPRAELYNAIGLQKHGKTVFYRDVLYHLRHSTDRFRIAPGIKGMVMLVFDLPSFPYVFKLIKDFYPSAKDTTREMIQSKYLLVKQHDRVGRMADTLEYSNVAFPKERFTQELIDEIRHFCPSLLEEDGDDYVLKHLYIERRMVPLNMYLQATTPAQRDAAVVEYGNAIKDLVAANIFPGDMLWKNFGVTRHDKVVFYDYDEIEYLTDCNFRRVPEPRNEEEEMSGEIWYHVGKYDIFPETFGTFLLGDPAVRSVFMRHHADLLDIAFWQKHQALIREGKVPSVYPYEHHLRFQR